MYLTFVLVETAELPSVALTDLNANFSSGSVEPTDSFEPVGFPAAFDSNETFGPIRSFSLPIKSVVSLTV